MEDSLFSTMYACSGSGWSGWTGTAIAPASQHARSAVDVVVARRAQHRDPRLVQVVGTVEQRSGKSRRVRVELRIRPGPGQIDDGRPIAEGSHARAEIVHCETRRAHRLHCGPDRRTNPRTVPCLPQDAARRFAHAALRLSVRSSTLAGSGHAEVRDGRCGRSPVPTGATPPIVEPPMECVHAQAVVLSTEVDAAVDNRKRRSNEGASVGIEQRRALLRVSSAACHAGRVEGRQPARDARVDNTVRDHGRECAAGSGPDRQAHRDWSREAVTGIQRIKGLHPYAGPDVDNAVRDGG